MHLATHALNCQQQIGAGFSRCRLLEEAKANCHCCHIHTQTHTQATADNRRMWVSEKHICNAWKMFVGRVGRHAGSRKQRFYLLTHDWWLATCRCMAKIKVKMERNCFCHNNKKQLQQQMLRVNVYQLRISFSFALHFCWRRWRACCIICVRVQQEKINSVIEGHVRAFCSFVALLLIYYYCCCFIFLLLLLLCLFLLLIFAAVA